MHSRDLKACLAGAAVLCFATSALATTDLTYNPQAELEAFKSHFGRAVAVEFDAKGEFVTHLRPAGSDLRIDPAPVTEAEFEAAARSIFDTYPSLFGYDSGALKLDRVWFLELEDVGTTNKVAVTFKQEVEGIVVEDGWSTILFDHQGRILSIDNAGLPGVQDDKDLHYPSLSENEAITVASRGLNREIEEVRGSEFVIFKYAAEGCLGAEARPAWLVNLRAVDKVEGVPVQVEYAIDAHTGQILDSRSTVHTVDLLGNTRANATPGNNPDTGSNPPQLRPLEFVRMNSSVGNDNTDINGDWTISYGGNNNQSVTANFNSASPYAWVVDQGGGEISQTQTVTPGVPAQFTLNGSPTQFDTAEVNSQVHIVTMRNYIQAISPGDNTFERRIRANTNINSNCNAYYDGSSINFFRAGSGCVNTAYSTVVTHEEGHWAVDLYQGGGSGAFHEGCADIWGMYVHDDNIVGRNFCGTGCHIRNGNNGRRKCNGCGEGCNGGAVHTEGQVIMGAFWKMRLYFNNRLGDAQGDLLADNLFMAWLQTWNDNRICDIIYTHILTLDDDNGNLSDGTPNCDDIQRAFEEDKGWPDMHDCSISQDCPAPCTDPVTYGNGTPGSGGLIPEIGNVNGCTSLGNQDFTLTVDKALGGATGALFIGFASDNTDGGGWTLLVQLNPNGIILPIVYGGAGAGNGTMSLNLPIPNNPFLDGMHVYFQATCNDPGAPNGVSATQGFDATLCKPN